MVGHGLDLAGRQVGLVKQGCLQGCSFEVESVPACGVARGVPLKSATEPPLALPLRRKAVPVFLGLCSSCTAPHGLGLLLHYPPNTLPWAGCTRQEEWGLTGAAQTCLLLKDKEQRLPPLQAPPSAG